VTANPPFSISVETTIGAQTARAFYELYLDTFSELATKAAARQVLHEHEFMDEMVDERVYKYLAHDQGGNVIAMCTLTKDLETVPWISAEYFAHHYPEHAARNAIYYLGFILVSHQHRRSRVFHHLIGRVVERLVADRSVCAYDLCSHNDEILGLGNNIEALLSRISEVKVARIDTQNYYRAEFGPVSG
jgi:hypothetical protein